MSENLRHDLLPRVAITGAGGQIGSFILTQLQIRGFSVFPVGKDSLLSDITEIKPDLIINCIGRGSDFRRECTEEEIWNSNYYVASEILNFAIDNKIRFLNIGSILEKEGIFVSLYRIKEGFECFNKGIFRKEPSGHIIINSDCLWIANRTRNNFRYIQLSNN